MTHSAADRKIGTSLHELRQPTGKFGKPVRELLDALDKALYPDLTAKAK